MPGFRQPAVVGAIALFGFLVWDLEDGRDRCAALSRAQAVSMAAEAKRGMLGRSTEDYRANFASEAVAGIELPPLANGYAAKVAYRGRDGSLLIALIEDDCYIGWTGR